MIIMNTNAMTDHELWYRPHFVTKYDDKFIILILSLFETFNGNSECKEHTDLCYI
jgi:hypothetical protein